MLIPLAEPEEFRRLLAICGGLDLLYIAVGVFLATRKGPLTRGFGVANIIQGSFLFVFDMGWWLVLGSAAS